jgi:branched-chain amino acid transport system ATP-binding protein
MLLETRNLSLAFGGVRAVDDVSLNVPAGQISALIGPNGAGKTTFFNILSGLLKPDVGTVSFNGADIGGLKPREIVHLGLVRTFQISSVFLSMTVFENVQIACQASSHLIKSVFSGKTRRAVAERADSILGTLGIGSLHDVKASELSYGDQRVLEIAVALSLRPKLLLLDEPTAGMSPSETGRIAKLVERLKSDVGIVIIEHDMEMIMGISDRISVFDRGKLIVEGSPSEIRADATVRQIYLGTTACST